MTSRSIGPLLVALMMLSVVGCSRPTDPPSPTAAAATNAPNAIGPTDAATQAEQKREALGQIGAAVTGQGTSAGPANSTSR